MKASCLLVLVCRRALAGGVDDGQPRPGRVRRHARGLVVRFSRPHARRQSCLARRLILRLSTVLKKGPTRTTAATVRASFSRRPRLPRRSPCPLARSSRHPPQPDAQRPARDRHHLRPLRRAELWRTQLPARPAPQPLHVPERRDAPGAKVHGRVVPRPERARGASPPSRPIIAHGEEEA